LFDQFDEVVSHFILMSKNKTKQKSEPQ